MYYLGIDGGGTKTAFSLMNEKGEIVASHELKTIHYMQIGMDEFKKRVKEGVTKILELSGVEAKDVAHAFLGTPGYGASKEMIQPLNDAAKEVMMGINFTCGNDVESCWAGALACKDVIALIAGTGSMTFGKVGKKSVTCGGWGPIIGDEGSAYYIGMKVINEFSKQADGRKPKTPLFDVVMQEMDFEDESKLIDLIYHEYKGDRPKIAQLAKLANLAYDKGCDVSKDIFDKAAYEQFLLIKATIKNLDMEDKNITVSYSGGVFRSGERILKPLKIYIDNYSSKVSLKSPIAEPVEGSCLYAKNLAKQNQLEY